MGLFPKTLTPSGSPLSGGEPCHKINAATLLIALLEPLKVAIRALHRLKTLRRIRLMSQPHLNGQQALFKNLLKVTQDTF